MLDQFKETAKEQRYEKLDSLQQLWSFTQKESDV